MELQPRKQEHQKQWGYNKLTQNGEERFNLDEDETTSDNSDDKNDEERFSLIDNNVILSQKLKCDGEK
jgi:hypothetical protein